MPATETSTSLIAVTKISGTNVFNPAGDKLGSIDDVMFDKATGRAIYVIMSCGGILGLGEHHHPLPWSILSYDRRLKGYVVNISREDLQKAPAFDRAKPADWTPDYGRKIDAYHKTPHYFA
jgi:hypothetical protein